jgi:hypothetical protein
MKYAILYLVMFSLLGYLYIVYRQKTPNKGRKKMKKLTVVPNGWQCTLKDCPPGLFLINDCLGIKTEYRPVRLNPLNGTYSTDTTDVEVYVASSGEVFWGGVTSKKERLELIVQPCIYQWRDNE